MLGIGLTWSEIIGAIVLLGGLIKIWNVLNVRIEGLSKDDETQKNQISELKKLVENLTNFNIKIVEHEKDIISIKKDLIEHKDGNEKSFNKLESLMMDGQKNNREDHGKLFDKFDVFTTQLSNATRTILNNAK